ncbi:fimbrial protein [Enterobacter mori]|uniref:fimbrial protein n=1 Tax=Enterobacter mori TaxID=539813 RepID=UPI001B8AA9C8|nr:fimbrial protein [Enterobacter mori]MBS3046388.1 fimbrial protein [Enterobacter mori]
MYCVRFIAVKSAIYLGLIISSLMFITHAHADCTTTQPAAINVPNLNVSRDVPVGSQIGNEVVAPDSLFISCATGAKQPAIDWGVKSYGTYVTTINGRRIYSTGMPGVGYAIGMQDTKMCNTGVTTYVSESNNQNMLCWKRMGTYSNFYAQGKAKITFYKIANPIEGGTVNSTNVGAAILLEHTTWSPEAVLRINSFKVVISACSVINPVINVPLGNVSKTAFSGPGSTVAGKNFTITLDCDSAASVNLTLDDPSGSSTAPGVLPITPETTKATASGVGVQVLYKNTPVTFGSLFHIGNAVSQGAMTIPLTARYYQTASAVTAGQANSVATFTLTYQ